ncbi:hypothetical protein [Microbispora sp. H11081]|uniref:hypothetical protein n=1 Tax=Microbispora sp. H11081 TaxID=2729107 RepID=UPI00147287A4|nr:hypothetical protein [Microbispora sp. H11081]
MRRGLTATLLILLHAILLTAGGAPASASTHVWETPRHAAAQHAAAAGDLRPADTRVCAPSHATRPAPGDAPHAQAGHGGHWVSGGPVVLPNPAAPRGGTRVTRAGPHHDDPPAQCPRGAATARAPPSTAY